MSLLCYIVFEKKKCKHKQTIIRSVSDPLTPRQSLGNTAAGDALTWSSLCFYVNKRRAHQCCGVYVVVDLAYDAIVATGDGDRGFVTLDLTDAVKLRHYITNLHIPTPGRQTQEQLFSNRKTDTRTAVFKQARDNVITLATLSCQRSRQEA